MALKDEPDFQLFTVQQVADLFPAADERKKKAHLEEVEALIVAHGCYRKFGAQILLTHSDVRGLLKAISNNSRASDGQPAPKSDGYVVVVGSRILSDANVYVGWAPVGGVERLINDVKLHAERKAELLEYAPMSYGDFSALRDTRLSKCRDYGNWYFRDKEVQAVFAELFEERLEQDE